MTKFTIEILTFSNCANSANSANSAQAINKYGVSLVIYLLKEEGSVRAVEIGSLLMGWDETRKRQTKRMYVNVAAFNYSTSRTHQ